MDGAGDGMLDRAGEDDKAKDIAGDDVVVAGERARVGTGATIVGVGELDLGVGAGVWIGSDGRRVE